MAAQGCILPRGLRKMRNVMCEKVYTVRNCYVVVPMSLFLLIVYFLRIFPECIWP